MAVELLQDAIVTVAAVGASVVVARRLLGVVAVKGKKVGGCDHCASKPASRKRTAGSGPGPGDSVEDGVFPVTLVRPSRR
jgi:hypothetical protein